MAETIRQIKIILLININQLPFFLYWTFLLIIQTVQKMLIEFKRTNIASKSITQFVKYSLVKARSSIMVEQLKDHYNLFKSNSFSWKINIETNALSCTYWGYVAFKGCKYQQHPNKNNLAYENVYWFSKLYMHLDFQSLRIELYNFPIFFMLHDIKVFPMPRLYNGKWDDAGALHLELTNCTHSVLVARLKTWNLR